jgi:hypothetical protein
MGTDQFGTGCEALTGNRWVERDAGGEAMPGGVAADEVDHRQARYHGRVTACRRPRPFR